ncbi:hypothetical protein J421_4423 [Gemmatirosa kalamazoonensis]|uniref:Uncharacterized protein n=1 Tax=Gemmatirosa kalamazoonensis TaxID=861299 RepID=W0RNP4_9BACT|nr:hypothetical protein [Gemmatirosa kalamazoonensis]AHG91960.1 hypothetical protein J421_4423 [Gemmatirosa kalamazoonensis]
MPARPTPRLTALLAIAVAAAAVAACDDATVEPTPPSTVLGKSASLADSAATAPTHSDSVRLSPDSVRPGPGTLWAVAVQNFVLQWKDAAGVAHDSVGFRGVAGASIAIYATTRPDSTSATRPTETLLATLASDATGQIHSAKLADGWYTLRASWASGGSTKTASASAQLVRGNQQPTIVYLNLR